MSAANATIFPLQNQPFPVPVAFRDTSGNLITGWTGAQSSIIVDRAAAVAGAAPVEVGATGYGYLDLTAAQMNGQIIGVVCTITNMNQTAFVGAIYTEPIWDNSSGPGTSNTIRPTDVLGKIAWVFQSWFDLHSFTRSTGIESVNSPSGGILTTGQTVGSDVSYQKQKTTP